MIVKLPFPPSINKYYYKGKILRPEGREFRKQVLDILKGYEYQTLETYVSLTVNIYPKDNIRRDYDNILKALGDALTHAKVYKDDYLIFDSHVRKHKGKKGTHYVIVEIKPFIID